MEKTAKNTLTTTVDEYLQAQPEAVKTLLEEIRQTIKAAAPQAEEVISYQIPTYKYRGALVHFAAFTKHCSFFGVSKNVFKLFEQELTPFKIVGTTIRFTLEKPLPAALVQKMVKARVQENEEKINLKTKSKAII